MSNQLEVWNSIESPSIYGIAKSTGYYLTYIFGVFLATKFLPSFEAKSPKKTYRLNGLLIFGLLSILIPLGYYSNQISLLFIVRNFYSFFIVSNVFAIAFSFYLFWRPEAVESAPDSNGIYDFWHGREKDPMFMGIDLKVFFYQPSLLGLQLINISFCEAQYHFHGTVTPGMICYQLFWYLYLLTHYLREDFMLWTFDIIEDHFGFMLVWGDGVYVPFLYSIVGWFIVDNVHPSQQISFSWISLILCLYFIGLYLFRETNWQKFNVKKHGTQIKIWGRPVELLHGKLLISGFWGIGRHLNYSGEILVYLCIAMCSGTSAWIPYILPLSLFVLLSQRAFRDDQRCKRKYGKVWEDYCKIAKFRMIPFIY